MKSVLDDKIILLKERIVKAVDQLGGLTSDIGHQGLISTIQDLKERIEEPFMFVIVGEVKAGKSSFINALLETDHDICKVAPSPMTDTIQQILYGDIPREEIINPYLKKIYQPVEILKDIAIVDTPGTNTIIEHHQEITERFIPGADLIVFVFEAKNPYRQSSWEFFGFIHEEWRKKIIFILQQKDLMPMDDLAINLEGVKKQAMTKGISDPVVMAVSAKLEQEGLKEDSGYIPLRKYIHEKVTGGKAPILKLESNVGTALSIADKIKNGIDLRQAQYDTDLAFREDIRTTLDKQTSISNDQVAVLVENLLAGYDNTMRAKTEELSQVLSFGAVVKRSISSIFSKEQSIKDWLIKFAKEMEEDLNGKLRNKLNERVLDLAESIQQMGQIIDLKIRSSKTILKDDNEIFSDIAEKRAKVLTELQEAFTNFLRTSENFKNEAVLSDQQSLSPALATGSGIAVVGVLLTIITNGMVFDITGGVITTIGLLFAGVSLGLQKRKIMKHFKEEVAKGRNRLQQDVTSRLKEYVAFIRTQIESNFNKFDQLLESEKKVLSKLNADYNLITQDLNGVSKEIEGTLNNT
jgi:ribosome biogenesis GTPase A